MTNRTETVTKLKRSAKDSVFTDLFSEPEAVLELYKVLHPEDAGRAVDDIEIVTIERVLSSGIYNDLGFTVGSRLVVLVEAQSTWSVNIAVRMLMYLAATYRKLIVDNEWNLHDSAPLKLPAPELHVIYTGGRKVPGRVSFTHDLLDGAESSLELTIDVITASEGIVGEYLDFAHLVDEVAKMRVGADDKVDILLELCRERGILKQYLEARRAEVGDIMFTLFDQEEVTRVTELNIARRSRAEGELTATVKSVSALMGAQEIDAEAAMDILSVDDEMRPAVLEQLQ